MQRGRSVGGRCMRAAWTLGSFLSRHSQQHARGLSLWWTRLSWYALIPRLSSILSLIRSLMHTSVDMDRRADTRGSHFSCFALAPCQDCVAETSARCLACCNALHASSGLKLLSCAGWKSSGDDTWSLLPGVH